MKKAFLLFLSLSLFYACLNDNDDDIPFTYKYLPIDEALTPDSFIFGKTDTIIVKYTLPNSCYTFSNLYYQYKDTTRIVAINTFVDITNSFCEKNLVQQEYKIPVNATQKEDYIFKFFKGSDSNGENIFEEVIVPVN